MKLWNATKTVGASTTSTVAREKTTTLVSLDGAIAGTGEIWNFSNAGQDVPQERLLIETPSPDFLQQLCFERRQQA